MSWRLLRVGGGCGGWGHVGLRWGHCNCTGADQKKGGGLNEKPPAQAAALFRETPITPFMLKLISNVFNGLAFLAAKMAAKHKMLCLRRSPNSCDVNHS